MFLILKLPGLFTGEAVAEGTLHSQPGPKQVSEVCMQQGTGNVYAMWSSRKTTVGITAVSTTTSSGPWLSSRQSAFQHDFAPAMSIEILTSCETVKAALLEVLQIEKHLLILAVRTLCCDAVLWTSRALSSPFLRTGAPAASV